MGYEIKKKTLSATVKPVFVCLLAHFILFYHCHPYWALHVSPNHPSLPPINPLGSLHVQKYLFLPRSSRLGKSSNSFRRQQLLQQTQQQQQLQPRNQQQQQHSSSAAAAATTAAFSTTDVKVQNYANQIFSPRAFGGGGTPTAAAVAAAECPPSTHLSIPFSPRVALTPPPGGSIIGGETDGGDRFVTTQRSNSILFCSNEQGL